MKDISYSRGTEMPDRDPRFFEKIAGAVPGLIVVYNIKSGRFVYVNATIRKILGYEPAELTTQGRAFVSTLVHPDDAPKIAKLNQIALDEANSARTNDDHNDPIVSFEYRMRHKNGNWRWLHTEGRVFDRDTDGSVAHVLNISIDITKRKEAEERLENLHHHLEETVQQRTYDLQQSDERYRAFISHSSEAIWRVELEQPAFITMSIDEQIRHFYKYAFLAECNVAMASMYGFSSPEELIGVRLNTLLVEEDPANIAYLTAFIESGYSLTDAESHEIDRDGNEKYFLNNLVGIIENGEIKRAWGTQRDVTNQKKAQHELQKINVRYQRLFDANIIGIIICGLDGAEAGKILEANDFFLNTFGFTRKQLERGDISWSEMTPDEYKYLDDYAIHELEECGECTPYEKVFIASNGNNIPIHLGIAMIPETKFCIAYILDISKRMELEHQKDDFLAIASHELKTPVTSLKAYAQVLKHKFEKMGDSSTALQLAKMDQQLSKLTSLINDLLDVTKIEAGKLQLSPQLFDADMLIEEIVETVQFMTDKHTIQVKGRTGSQLYADRERIGQVLINMLTNAIKYSPHADTVIVQLKIKENMIQVLVQDFGVGLSEESQTKVFERFYRVSGEKENTFPGLGLGLYISAEIVKRHRGQIGVKSVKGKGTTFYFTIPTVEITNQHYEHKKDSRRRR